MFSHAPSPVLWIILIAVAAFDFLYISLSSLSISVIFDTKLIECATSLTALWAFGFVYRTIRPNTIISNVSYSTLYFFLASFFCGLASYIAASFALPLNDELFARIDLALGFDWLGFLTFVNSHDWLAESLTFAYHILGIQILTVIAILSITGRHERLNEFLGLFVICAIMTVMLAAAFPAAGAYAFHKPDASLFTHRSVEAGMWHYQDLLQLRDGSMKTLTAFKMEGIVTFPSFHTCVAVITAWALRDYRWAFAFACLISLIVIVSTLTEGGHYLIDVIAGIIVTVTATLVVWPIANKTNRMERLSAAVQGLGRQGLLWNWSQILWPNHWRQRKSGTNASAAKDRTPAHPPQEIVQR